MPQADAKDHFTEESGRSSLWLAAISWSFSILYMFFIFFLSRQSHPPLASLADRWNFPAHFLEYWPLGFLLSWSLASSGVRRGIALYGFLIALGYGIFDELHQYFVPERAASLRDVIADGIGSLLGSYAFKVIRSADWLNAASALLWRSD